MEDLRKQLLILVHEELRQEGVELFIAAFFVLAEDFIVEDVFY